MVETWKRSSLSYITREGQRTLRAQQNDKALPRHAGKQLPRHAGKQLRLFLWENKALRLS